MANDSPDSWCADLLKAYNSGDLEGVMDCYADDCVYVFPGLGFGRGTGQIREAWKSLLEKYDKTEFKGLDQTACGDAVTEVGEFAYYGKNGDLHGWYCAMLVKRDGKWLCKYDVSVFK